MIRRFLPKGTSFKALTQEEVKRIEKWINNYPRKILKFKTSEEYYEEQIKVAQRLTKNIFNYFIKKRAFNIAMSNKNKSLKKTCNSHKKVI